MVAMFLTSLLSGLAFCQSFEVASVKPSPPPDPARGTTVRADGGPGTNDPARFTTRNLNLRSLVTMAYTIESYRLSGPDWLINDMFDVEAKVPEGATKEQFRIMLRNLLRERFGLEVHSEQREMQTYSLTLARGGPKFKESAGEAESRPDGFPAGPKLDPDGFPALPPGRTPYMAIMYDRARMRVIGVSMADFANRLAVQLGHPVTDATGLSGKYDLTLSWVSGSLRPQAGDADSPGPDLLGAVQEQLGLKLEPKKGPVEMIVIDHIEKLPTEN